MTKVFTTTLTMAQAVRNVVEWGMVSAPQALRMASEIPARSVGLDGQCGLIAEGRAADLVVLDQDLVLKETYIAGRVVA